MLTIGGVPARTVTLKVQVLVLWAELDAVTVTTLVPTGKADPEGGFAVTLAKEQSSLPEMVNVTTAGQLPVAVTVILVEHVASGGVMSSAIGTFVEPVALQPAALLMRRVKPTLPDAPAE